MANSKIPTVQLTDTFNTQRNRFNSLVDSVGDVSTLTTTSKNVTGAILELDAELGTITAGAMGTTASTVSNSNRRNRWTPRLNQYYTVTIAKDDTKR